MNRFHIAINTHDIAASVEDYTRRLGTEPEVLVADEYALWRTVTLNVSVRKDCEKPLGLVRHLGWEDPQASDFTESVDVNGIVWENFSAQQQEKEIIALWPKAAEKN